MRKIMRRTIWASVTTSYNSPAATTMGLVHQLNRLAMQVKVVTKFHRMTAGHVAALPPKNNWKTSVPPTVPPLLTVAASQMSRTLSLGRRRCSFLTTVPQLTLTASVKPQRFHPPLRTVSPPHWRYPQVIPSRVTTRRGNGKQRRITRLSKMATSDGAMRGNNFSKVIIVTMSVMMISPRNKKNGEAFTLH